MNKTRNTAIDLFRGITVIVMIIVNNPGDWKYIYSPLKHPPWNGLSLADLVFPFFIIAVGMSIPFAMHKKITFEGKTNMQIVSFVFKRSIVLFLIGVFLNAFPYFEWEGLRIPGVLQRIALVYLFCSFIFLFIKSQYKQGILFVLILIGYYLLIVKIPPPDWNGEGDFLFSPVSNWGAYIDRLILEGHLWKYTKSYDPEGLLGTIPSIATGMIGLWIGCFWIHRKNLLWIMGLVFLVLGLVFSEFFPINKNIWSSSFVLVTGGIGLLFFYLLDVFGNRLSDSSLRFYSPIFIMGRHALLVFFLIGVLSRLLVLNRNGVILKNIIMDRFFQMEDPYMGSLLYSLVYLGFIYIILTIYNFLVKLIKI